MEIPPRVPDVSGMGVWRKGPKTTNYHTGQLVQTRGQDARISWPEYNMD